MTKELWISRDSKKYGNYLYTCEPEKGCVDEDIFLVQKILKVLS
jgi:hypothetical protein